MACDLLRVFSTSHSSCMQHHSTKMTQYWRPGTQYNYGDVVEFQGRRYKILQPHRSQGDWIPPANPALWGRLNNDPGKEKKKNSLQDGKHKELDIGGGVLAGAAALAGAYALKTHLKHQEQPPQGEVGGGIFALGAAVLAGGAYLFSRHYEDQGKAQEQPRQNEPQPWYQEHGTGLGIGAAAAALAGAFAYKKREEHKREHENDYF